MFRLYCAIFLLTITATASSSETGTPLLITDPGNAVLPETSLPALATAMIGGAEIIQVELVMTRDAQLIALPDIDLGNHTDVARVFPDRADADGTFPSIAFSFPEIKELSLLPPPGKDPGSGTGEPSSLLWPTLRVPTLADVIALIRLLEEPGKSPPALCVELKKNWRHLDQGLDPSSAVTAELKRLGYPDADERLYLAAYDPEELQRLHDTLLPGAGLQARLIQLVDRPGGNETMRRELGIWQPYNYEWLLTKFGLKAASAYADSLGLYPDVLVGPSGSPQRQDYLEDAHLLGMSILAYPFDRASEPLPDFSPDLASFIRLCLTSAGFDGLLTRHGQTAGTIIAELTEIAEKARKGPQNAIEKLLEEVKRERPQPPATGTESRRLPAFP